MEHGRGDGRELQVLIDTQWGLFTQSQVTELGYSRNRVRALVDSGAWIAVLRGVYSIFTGPLTRQRTLMAALLYGGGHAMLSHRSAAEEWAFCEPDPAAAVHVTVPYGKSACNQRPTVRSGPTVGTRLVAGIGSSLHPGVVVHRSRAHRHIGVPGDMPRTTLVDTALDLAVSEPTPEQAFHSLVSSVTQRRIRLTDVREQIAVRRPYRYLSTLTEAIDLLATGVQSVLELEYATNVEAAHGLPTTERQSAVQVDGRTLYEDVVYRVGSRTVTVRLDGRRFHSMREVAFRDRRRDNAAELAGRARLVFGYEEVSSDPCGVARDVALVLQREGWDGEPTSCALCVAAATHNTHDTDLVLAIDVRHNR
ncbi:hypothetical protein CH275_02480 [Rhodococcus sp. 06-235-1A]|uniref:type IV toxin-antitoxin system AbiEi family antitoxin domain-containing protein n=1 Tax=Rhodococcus sp. 06-235-1A TaxID=2022508 RepID=UPI000B9B1883|nr:type IV toxin-antitoxin system AbiEi family antitoxin domain-containing protein [Rhodococcus sp. 06-235-1A]OZD09131.1 hypothetical protein CH275_02480 [Rhodococcus sp. 06-235-1A]